MEEGLLIARLVCMFSLLIGTLVFGILPIYVRRRLKCDGDGVNCDRDCRCQRGKRITAFLIFFGGGVLLGTTFLHLLPEAREGFETDDVKNCTTDDTNNTNSTDGGDDVDHETFSMPEFIVCLGFFAVYLFEMIVHHFLPDHDHIHVPCDAPNSTSNYGSCNQNSNIPSVASESSRIVSDASLPLIGDGPKPATQHMTIGAILTFAALSFHSFFEGFAVGLRPDVVSTIIVFIAISIHKFVLAFVIGLQYVADCSAKWRKGLFGFVTVFAFMSPVGMAIAMLTAINVEDSNPLTISVLNAISTGTLVYVTFFEILRGNSYQDYSHWAKFIATAIGFATLALIQFGSTFA